MTRNDSQFLRHFNTDGATNLYQWVRDVTPSFVCAVPHVEHTDFYGNCLNVPEIVVSSNIHAIKQAWGLARGFGEATLSYDPINNVLVVREGIHYGQNTLVGQVGMGLIQTAANNIGQTIAYQPRSEEFIQHFYGIEDYYSHCGISVISPQLVCLINSYIKLVFTLVHRVENSYGSLLSLEGLDMEDVPLLQSVQDKIDEDWQKSRRAMAPGSSKIGELDISLTDTDKVLIPLEHAIATEAQVPRELLFPNKTASQFELEKLSIWAKPQFQSIVSPALWRILKCQGYNVKEIHPPSYRDSHYDVSVKNLLADTQYKESATAKNYKAVEVMGEKNENSQEDSVGLGYMGRQL